MLETKVRLEMAASCAMILSRLTITQHKVCVSLVVVMSNHINARHLVQMQSGRLHREKEPRHYHRMDLGSITEWITDLTAKIIALILCLGTVSVVEGKSFHELRAVDKH